MKGFILAAGFGERLRPLTDAKPKPLLPVLNLPVICYSLLHLKESGVTEIVINLHYRYRDVIQFLESHDFFGMNITFSVEDMILGTGGGLKKCEHLLSSENFILINSDILLDIPIGPVIEKHMKSSSPATLLLYQTDQAGIIGPVGIKGDHIVDFDNHRGTGTVSDFIYTGVAVLSPVIFKYLKDEFSCIVETGYSGLIDEYSLGYLPYQGFWQDIGTISSFWKANILNGRTILDLKDRMQNALNLKPTYISPFASVGNEAIVSESVLGEGSVVEGRTVVERSVVLSDSIVQNNASIKDSIVMKDHILKVL